MSAIPQIPAYHTTKFELTLQPIIPKTDINQIFISIIENLKESLLGLPILSIENKSIAYEKINTILYAIQAIRQVITPDEDKEFKKLFQKSLHSLILQSDFCRYCFNRPKGYAGDYLAMEKIWEARVGISHSNETALGRAITEYTMSSANAKANEFRVYYLQKLLTSNNWKTIGSLGCGGAIEIRELIKSNNLNQEADYHLFDNDQDALESVAKRCFSLNAKLHFHSGNILYSFKKEKIKFDLIYASGLFDYLNIFIAKKLLGHLFNQLNPNGKIVIINADPGSKTRIWMEYGADWNLNYKTKENLLFLAEDLEDTAQINADSDPFHVYNYLEIRKT